LGDYVFLRLSTKYVTDTDIAEATIATIIINLPVKEIGARSTGGDGTGDSENNYHLLLFSRFPILPNHLHIATALSFQH
jgi:hypothetical protein